MRDLVAYNRDDGMVFLDFDGAEGFQFANDGLELGDVFDGDGYGHFRGGDHIDGGAVFFEDLEYLPQETVSEEHATAPDIDGDNAVFGSYGLYAFGTGGFGDQGAFGPGLHGIEQPDGHLIELSGPDGSGMEDLGAEVSQLSGFFEAELFDGHGLFDDAGVVVMHTVDIGPDLADGSVDGGGGEGGGVVGAG